MRLIGCDISRYQNSEEIPRNASFVILKATEGRTHVDLKMKQHLEYIAKYHKDNLPIIGFYHFITRNNTPEAEADHFLNTIKPHIGKCLMVLDIEGMAAADVNASIRARQFCDHIKQRTKVTPVLYTSRAYLNKFTDCDAHLWVANYNVKEIPKNQIPEKWRGDPYMWQFTSSPMDLDLFYGARGELAAWALPND